MSCGVMNTLKNLSNEKLEEFRSQLYAIVELETAIILNILQIVSEYVYVHGGRWGRGHLHLQNILKLLSSFYLIWKHIYKWIACIQMFRDLKLHKMMDIYIQTPSWLLCFVGRQYRLISTSNFVTFSKFEESVLLKQVRYLDLGFNWHL